MEMNEKKFTISEKALAEHEQFRQMLEQARKRSEVDEICAGQVWLGKFKGLSETVFLLTSSNPFSAKKKAKTKAPDSIRVVPLANPYHELDTDKGTDICISHKDIALGIECLAQWWNEANILVKNLKIYYGELDERVYTKVVAQIKKAPKVKKNSESVELYRRVEKEKGKLYSAEYNLKAGIESDAMIDVLVSELEIYPDPIILSKLTLEKEQKKHEDRSGWKVVSLDMLELANERLALAASDGTDEYQILKKHVDESELTLTIVKMDGSDIVRLESLEQEAFRLIITDEEGEKNTYSSNEKGVLDITLKDINKAQFIDISYK
jgi:hypothetical protein